MDLRAESLQCCLAILGMKACCLRGLAWSLSYPRDLQLVKLEHSMKLMQKALMLVDSVDTTMSVELPSQGA